MGFTEVTFLFVFLPLSIILYLAADRIFHQTKLNNALLVILSFIFYYWAQKEAVLFVVLTGLFIYLSGQMLEKREDPQAPGQFQSAGRVYRHPGGAAAGLHV